MNRYELFHEITTNSQLDSMRSIINVCLDRLIREANCVKGAWFGLGVGGLRALGARDNQGVVFGSPDQHFPLEMAKRAISLKQPTTAELPGLKSSIANTGRGTISRYIAVPVIHEHAVSGILFLERRFQQASFSSEIMETLIFVCSGVQQLLNSSHDFERQRYEMDQMKSRMAMDKVKIVSKHPSMLHLFRLIQKLSRVPATVLINGESGTGKELVARAIYELGQYDGPFIAINCGGIEPNLLKSELFGYLKGSFTGAAKDRPGLFKKAEGGILFLDEIGEMPMDMQVALLRTLEVGEILPVGADMPLQVNTRVVAATHRNLKDMVEKDRFRNDLYQRLKGITLCVPPLRDRRSDIPHLCDYFVRKYNDKFGLAFKGLRTEASELLAQQEFQQGNVRELEHMIERAMVFEDDPEFIGTQYLIAEDQEESDLIPSSTVAEDSNGAGSFEEKMNRFACKLLNDTIRTCKGNKTKAMKTLGLSRSTFYGMLNRYGVELSAEKL